MPHIRQHRDPDLCICYSPEPELAILAGAHNALIAHVLIAEVLLVIIRRVRASIGVLCEEQQGVEGERKRFLLVAMSKDKRCNTGDRHADVRRARVTYGPSYRTGHAHRSIPNVIAQWLLGGMETQAERDAAFKERLEKSETFRKASVHVHSLPSHPDKWWQSEALMERYSQRLMPYKRGFGKLQEANSVKTSLVYHQHVLASLEEKTSA
ncbi:hypothetical protein JKP88DRAFT_261625 [Tribonema minus]|uniref:Uncharacterized protein n=1 Tax=Tribonema minus TaxID=303371 RepID=A0A836C7J4_9STRA|nr:hypothetical protein JKP88DRAFT_261625 [Tribonema minus]